MDPLVSMASFLVALTAWTFGDTEVHMWALQCECAIGNPIDAEISIEGNFDASRDEHDYIELSRRA